MVLADVDIQKYIDDGKLSIEPLSAETIRENGVDLRVGDEIIRFQNTDSPVSLTKESLEKIYRPEKIEKEFVIHPNERVLIKTKELIKMPDDLVGFCGLRSSMARLGFLSPPTIVDAGYQGNLTIQITGGMVPVHIERDARFLHLVLDKTISKVGKPYNGKYQNSKNTVGTRI